MTPEEYQEKARRTQCSYKKALARVAGHLTPIVANALPDPLRAVKLLHAGVGLAAEAGEVAQVGERWLYYGQPLDLDKLKDELGDCMWYISLACDVAGVTLEEVMEHNINKLAQRHPEGFDAKD